MQGKLFIDGRWAEAASGATFPTFDPATEEPIQEVARGGRVDIDRAVQAAERAMHGPWRETAPAERGASCSASPSVSALHARISRRSRPLTWASPSARRGAMATV